MTCARHIAFTPEKHLTVFAGVASPLDPHTPHQVCTPSGGILSDHGKHSRNECIAHLQSLPLVFLLCIPAHPGSPSSRHGCKAWSRCISLSAQHRIPSAAPLAWWHASRPPNSWVLAHRYAPPGFSGSASCAGLLIKPPWFPLLSFVPRAFLAGCKSGA